MGILAGNSVVEGGEIIYKGSDLLKYTEKDFDKIRGNKVTMIFQDPLSSLDPIVKIGKQMTEATILNGKTNQKAAKKEFRHYIRLLKKTMTEAGCESAAQTQLEAFARLAEKSSSLDGAVTEVLLENLAKALTYAENKVRPEKEKAVFQIRTALPLFEQENPPAGVWEKETKELAALVERSMNPLSLHINTFATTFETTMNQSIRRYYKGVKENPQELKRVEKETAKRNKLLEKNGDAPNIVPAVLVDLKLTQKSMITALTRLADSYEKELRESKVEDGLSLAGEMITHLKELTAAMHNKVTKQMAYDKAIRIMEDVGIKDAKKRFNQYPFEFSGGMRQRIVIAIAIAANPDILICDEPTTALDVTIQAQIMELINEIKEKQKLSVIFITHDLGVVANMADKVAVMYAGKIVEYGTADDIFYHPAHPYTWALLASMPDLDTKEKLEAIPGTPPNMIYPPVGDAFAERNQYAMQIDFEKQPPLFRISDTHFAATWLLHPDAPKVEPPKSVTDRIKRIRELEAAANE
jgi:oligopeptide/dipeptide ABC transporter ATP-binding protein